ncbi:hypothetical protein ABBQ38_011846 [Trebouxia sp. C0009 RCD-2024]
MGYLGRPHAGASSGLHLVTALQTAIENIWRTGVIHGTPTPIKCHLPWRAEAQVVANLFVLTHGDLQSEMSNRQLDVTLPAFTKVSAQGLQCLKAMLERDDTQRPPAERLLNSQWLNSRKWFELAK